MQGVANGIRAQAGRQTSKQSRGTGDGLAPREVWFDEETGAVVRQTNQFIHTAAILSLAASRKSDLYTKSATTG